MRRIPKHPFTVAEDLTALTNLLTEIKAFLDAFEGNRTSSEFKKIEAQLTHATARLGRVLATTEEERRHSRRYCGPRPNNFLDHPP